MRKIERIFIHCTASSQSWGVDELKKEFKRKGWTHAGYHYVITKDGGIHQMEALENIANGVKGYNDTAIHIAYVGGVMFDAKNKITSIAVDNRTDEQKASLLKLVRILKAKFPEAKVLGHRDISPDTNKNGKVDAWERIKECPSFDVQTLVSEL